MRFSLHFPYKQGGVYLGEKNFFFLDDPHLGVPGDSGKKPYIKDSTFQTFKVQSVRFQQRAER